MSPVPIYNQTMYLCDLSSGGSSSICESVLCERNLLILVFPVIVEKRVCGFVPGHPCFKVKLSRQPRYHVVYILMLHVLLVPIHFACSIFTIFNKLVFDRENFNFAKISAQDVAASK